MRHHALICLCVFLSVSISGSADGNPLVVEKGFNVSALNSLRSLVRNSRQVLQAQMDLNWNYGLQVKLLADKLAEIDSGLLDVQQSSLICDERGGKLQQVSLSELDNQTRINILGERALLGYKAQLLETELDRLTQGVGDRNETFAHAMAKAEDLSEQIVSLRLSIREGRGRSVLRSLDPIAEEEMPAVAVSRTVGPTRNQTQYVPDKELAGPILLAASAAATSGKSGPGAAVLEPEAKAATSDLRKKIDEIAKQTKALQQLIIEASQRAEFIKRLEKQTYSKLADMEQLKKSWEGRKIPINEEVVALEKKLNGDLMMYHEILKEVETFNKQLVSMLNAILYKESETSK